MEVDEPVRPDLARRAQIGIVTVQPGLDQQQRGERAHQDLQRHDDGHIGVIVTPTLELEDLREIARL